MSKQTMTWDSSSGYAFNSGSYSDFEQPKAHNAAVQGGEGWGSEGLLPRGRAPRVKGEDCDLHEVVELVDVSCSFCLIFLQGLTLGARVLQGREIVPTLAPMHLRTTIAESMQLSSIGISAAPGVVIEYTMDKHLDQNLVTDSQWLRRSIVNLLANACRFTVEGCIKLSISKVPDKVSAEEWIQFTVSDTGTGCEQEDASQAFEPYFSTSESVGLGLFVVKQQTVQLGGCCGMVSCKPQGGCEVWFRIPYLTPERHREQSNDVEPKEGPSILLIEAVDCTIQLNAAELRSGGFRVTEVHGPEDGMQKLMENNFTMALCSDEMPYGWTTEGFATEYREWEAELRPGSHVPLWAFCARPTDAVRKRQLLCAGMDGVTDEPMGVDLVNRICSGRLRETPSVLLVDDVRPVLMLQAMWLRTAGFEVTVASNAAAALRELKQRKFSVLLCDVNMPCTGGVGLIQAFREWEMSTASRAQEKQLILMLSAYSSFVDEQQGDRLGVKQVLDKPLDPDQLCAVFQQLNIPVPHLEKVGSKFDALSTDLCLAVFEHAGLDFRNLGYVATPITLVCARFSWLAKLKQHRATTGHYARDGPVSKDLLRLQGAPPAEHIELRIGNELRVSNESNCSQETMQPPDSGFRIEKSQRRRRVAVYEKRGVDKESVALQDFDQVAIDVLDVGLNPEPHE